MPKIILHNTLISNVIQYVKVKFRMVLYNLGKVFLAYLLRIFLRLVII